MPRIKRAAPFDRMRRLLLGYGLSATELAKILGCSYNTARARLERPEGLTLSDLAAIHYKGHVPIEDIRAAIGGRT